jgi:hypothetical protein
VRELPRQVESAAGLAFDATDLAYGRLLGTSGDSPETKDFPFVTNVAAESG